MSSSQSKTVTVESIFELDFLRGKRPKEDAPKISATFLASLPLLQNSEYSGDVVLITGANKGIGYETARLLGARGLKVLVGCRDNERGQAAEKQLREDNKSGSFHFIQLDVASETSITAAVDSISKTYGHLDVLVNNAGIMDFSSPSETSGEKLRNVFATNAFGPMLLTKACLPLLQKSSHPRVVNVSSGLGSADSHNPVNGTYLSINNSTYCCSKAALDLYTVLLANEMRTKQPALRVNVIDPGYTATDLNHHSGPQTLSEGTDAIIAASLLSATGPTGAFFNRFGYVAW